MERRKNIFVVKLYSENNSFTHEAVKKEKQMHVDFAGASKLLTFGPMVIATLFHLTEKAPNLCL